MKINLSVPEEFSEALGELSKKLGKSRSEVIREAFAAYDHLLKLQEEEERIKRQRKDAAKNMDELREKIGRVPGWDSVKVIREWRDRDRFARLSP